MKSLNKNIVSLVSSFGEFHQKIILENMIRNCEFLTESNNKQHIAKLTEFHLLAERAESDDNVLIQVERVGEYIETLESQSRDLKQYHSDLLISYEEVVGKAYEPSVKRDTKAVSKNAQKYLKKFAQS